MARVEREVARVARVEREGGSKGGEGRWYQGWQWWSGKGVARAVSTEHTCYINNQKHES